MMKPLVLLVDDEVPFVETMTKRLKKRDLLVNSAYSGQEALDILDKHRNTDVVILDVKMPGMDGIETLEKIKKSFPLTEVVMLTGHATVESAIEGMKKGAYDYLMKPCDIDQLMQKVEEATQKKTVHEDKIREAKVKEAMSMHGLEQKNLTPNIGFRISYLHLTEPGMDQNKGTLNGYYSLTRNMLLVIILVAIIPMIVVSSIILYQFDTSYHEKVYAHLEELVLKHKHNIDGFLKQKLGDIRLLGKTFSYEELSDESFLRERLELLQKIYGPVFVDLGVVNAQGLQVAYAGPFKLGEAVYSSARWFQAAMKSDVFKSDVFLGLRGLPHFIIAVRENDNGQPWILRATVDFVAFNNLVEKIRIGETGFAFILNRKGEFQTKPFFDLISNKEPYTGFLRDSKKFMGGVHIIERDDDSGNKVIYVAALLKHGDWLLVYQQNSSDAFSDLRKTLRVTIAIMLLASICIVMIAFVLSKRMVNRVASADHEKEMMNEQIVETGKLASVGELASGIAHEINNPVAIMVEEAGWIEDLLEEEEFKEGENLSEFKRALEQIRTQGRRCKEITHKLLSFARKTDSRTQDVQLNDLIEELIALSAQRAKFANVDLNVNLQENLPILHVSQTELQQVLLNLINNALDALEEPGGTLNVSNRLEGEYIVVEVEDDGPGIPEANIARIFDPFFTTKPVGKGTGLGLSICYGIIKKMGGDIIVKSTMEVGTTFRVKIPIPKDEDQTGN